MSSTSTVYASTDIVSRSKSIQLAPAGICRSDFRVPAVLSLFAGFRLIRLIRLICLIHSPVPVDYPPVSLYLDDSGGAKA